MQWLRCECGVTICCTAVLYASSENSIKYVHFSSKIKYVWLRSVACVQLQWPVRGMVDGLRACARAGSTAWCWQASDRALRSSSPRWAAARRRRAATTWMRRRRRWCRRRRTHPATASCRRSTTHRRDACGRRTVGRTCTDRDVRTTDQRTDTHTHTHHAVNKSYQCPVSALEGIRIAPSRFPGRKRSPNLAFVFFSIYWLLLLCLI